MASLESMAADFLKRTPRQNPPDEDQDEALFNQFIVSLRSKGIDVSDWTEGDWFKAARKFGFDEEDLGSLMEQVAAWGVDDS
jgi:hypothetical protein